MWTDYFLKAPDEASFNAACPWKGENDSPLPDSHDHSLIVVGILSYGAEYDTDGNQVVAPTLVPGWHVNVRLREGVVLPEALEPFNVGAPAYPKRVFI